ncbi:MAG: hypothetical protein R2774_07175 [Saprospiraceae bacterium]
MTIKEKYFFYAIVLMGSAGVWIPILIELIVNQNVDFHSVPPNIVTYFVSLIFAGSVDYFIKKLKNIEFKGIEHHFFNFIGISLLSLALTLLSIYLSIKKVDIWAMLFGIVGVIISYRVWWISNMNDEENNKKYIDIMGGDPNNKKLPNG